MIHSSEFEVRGNQPTVLMLFASDLRHRLYVSSPPDSD